MRDEFKKIADLLFRLGLVGPYGGEISVRRENKMFITRRDAPFSGLEESDIIECEMDGALGELAARGALAHRAIYKETKAEAIIFAQPVSAIAVSITDNKIIPQDAQGLSLIKSAAIVRTHQQVITEEICRLLPSFLQGSSVAAVVKGMGSFAIGKTIEEACKYTSTLENSCKILVAIRSSGGVRPPVPQKEKIDIRPPHRRSAIPPGIGVMDRSRYKR